MYPEPQNVYDDSNFFAGYSQMERFIEEWGAGMEHATFLELLPDPRGLRILDLGCGGGQLALHLAKEGATEIVATDLSEQMLMVARNKRSSANIDYRQGAMEDLEFPDSYFDLVASSLAFHYVSDYRELVRRIDRWLKPDGSLVFSTEHPIYSSRASQEGWQLDENGKPVAWVIDNYSEEGVREHRWFVEGVRRYHRPMSTLFNALIEVGLQIERVEEPIASAEWIQSRPGWAEEYRRPMFLLVKARKRVRLQPDSPAIS